MAHLCPTLQWSPCSQRQSPSLHGEQLARPVGSGLPLPALTSCCSSLAQLLHPCSLLFPRHTSSSGRCTCLFVWNVLPPTFTGSPSASVRSFPKVLSQGLPSVILSQMPTPSLTFLYSLHDIHHHKPVCDPSYCPLCVVSPPTSLSSTGQGFHFFIHCCTPSAYTVLDAGKGLSKNFLSDGLND